MAQREEDGELNEKDDKTFKDLKRQAEDEYRKAEKDLAETIQACSFLIYIERVITTSRKKVRRIMVTFRIHQTRSPEGCTLVCNTRTPFK